MTSQKLIRVGLHGSLKALTGRTLHSILPPEHLSPWAARRQLQVLQPDTIRWIPIQTGTGPPQGCVMPVSFEPSSSQRKYKHEFTTDQYQGAPEQGPCVPEGPCTGSLMFQYSTPLKPHPHHATDSPHSLLHCINFNLHQPLSTRFIPSKHHSSSLQGLSPGCLGPSRQLPPWVNLSRAFSTTVQTT